MSERIWLGYIGEYGEPQFILSYSRSVVVAKVAEHCREQWNYGALCDTPIPDDDEKVVDDFISNTDWYEIFIAEFPVLE